MKMEKQNSFYILECLIDTENNFTVEKKSN